VAAVAISGEAPAFIKEELIFSSSYCSFLPIEIKAKKAKIIIIKPIQLFKKLNNYFPRKFI